MEQRSLRDNTFTRACSELILSKPRGNSLSMFKTVEHGEEQEPTQGVLVYTKHNGSRCYYEWKSQRTLTQCGVTEGPLLKVNGKIHSESEDEMWLRNLAEVVIFLVGLKHRESGQEALWQQPYHLSFSCEAHQPRRLSDSATQLQLVKWTEDITGMKETNDLEYKKHLG